MKLHVVYDPSEEHLAGPYTDLALAETVLKIFRMTIDEESEIWTLDTDEHSSPLKAKLLPWKITILLDCGRIQSTDVVLCWPPQAEALRMVSSWRKVSHESLISVEV
ncbi:MAG: hypothetical protein WC291_08040 [Thermodesulfovibrionales bacterium]